MMANGTQRKSGKCNPVYVPKLFKPLERFLWRKVYLFYTGNIVKMFERGRRSEIIVTEGQSEVYINLRNIGTRTIPKSCCGHIDVVHIPLYVTNNHKHYKHILRGRYCFSGIILPGSPFNFLSFFLFYSCRSIFICEMFAQAY